MKRFTVSPTMEGYEELQGLLEEWLEENDVPMNFAMKLDLVTEEVFVNIVNYSGAENSAVSCGFDSGILSMIFEDDGVEFDPTKAPEPDIEAAVEDRKIGGLGIFLVRKFMDTVEYSREGGKNILRLTKKL